MAWAYVQGNTFQNGAPSTTTYSGTLTSAVGSGNLLCVSIGYAGTATTVTVTDDKSNTYTAAGNATDTASVYSWYVFYLTNITNGPKTITVNFSATQPYVSIIADEFSGGGAATLDGHAAQAQHTPPTGSNNITSGPFTTTQNGDLVYGSTVDIPGSGTTTAGSGFTIHQNVAATFITEHLVQATAGSTAATFNNGSPPASVTAGMAFAPAVTGGAAALVAPQLASLPVGRMAGYKNLLNAAAPSAPVVIPPAVGSTLPFMGVG